MSKLLNASICLTDILEQAKKGHSAFSKGKNGKIYFSANIWINDEKDKYDNDASLSLNSKKENKEKEGKIYIGNAKYSKSTRELGNADTAGLGDDLNIPERNKKNEQQPAFNDEF